MLSKPFKTVIKKNAIIDIGKYIKDDTKNCLLIAGRHFVESEDMDIVSTSLYMNNIDYQLWTYAIGEPEVYYIDEIAAFGRAFGADAVLAIGGGSVLDTGKSVAAMLTNEGSVYEYMEIEGQRQLVNKPVPFFAVPTTAGTGAEASKNAVIIDKSRSIKKSFRSDSLFARLAVIDPMLQLETPNDVTAYSGMDALTQLIESYTAKKAVAQTDELCLEGIKHCKYLSVAYADGGNYMAREEMAKAAYISGVVLANVGLGAVHGLASPIGAYTGLPHGKICAVLLPHIMEVNKLYCVEKYADVGRLLSGNSMLSELEAADRAIECVRSLNKSFGIPEDFKGTCLGDHAAAIAAEAYNIPSMLNNPMTADMNYWTEFLLHLS